MTEHTFGDFTITEQDKLNARPAPYVVEPEIIERTRVSNPHSILPILNFILLLLLLIVELYKLYLDLGFSK